MIFLESSMGIFLDKSQFSSTTFLRHLVDARPYTIEVIFSDNSTVYKGTPNHEFVKIYKKYHINQKFTKSAKPQTHGRAERVIRVMSPRLTLPEDFKDRDFLKIMRKRSMQGIVLDSCNASHSARKIIKRMLLR